MMPIHDVGYRKWLGEKTSQTARWMSITSTGVRLALKSNWIKRILFAAWLPLMYWGAGFFLMEKTILQVTEPKPSAMEQVSEGIEKTAADIQQGMSPTQAVKKNAAQAYEAAKTDSFKTALSRNLKGGPFAGLPQSQELIEALESDNPSQIRHKIWSWLLMSFFRYPQALLLVFLVGSVAPALISRDIRSRAFLLYFSKPISRWDYLLGKLAIPAFFIMAVTTLPALALYGFAILMSPDASVMLPTLDIPIRILLASVVLVVPTCSIALMLSSLTQESRFASFAWFGVWLLGHGAYFAVVVATAIQMRRPPFDPEVTQSGIVESWSVLSLYNCLGEAQAFVFGFSSFSDSWRAFFVLSIVTLVAITILYRRVSSPTQV